jgi:hypothetical protein
MLEPTGGSDENHLVWSGSCGIEIAMEGLTLADLGGDGHNCDSRK